MCLNGYWGSVCSNGWDANDAVVACRQAGYKTLSKSKYIGHYSLIVFLIGAIPTNGGYFGKGIGPVHMTSVACTGEEQNLTQCPYSNGIGVTNCYHDKDVGVICTGKTINMSI